MKKLSKTEVTNKLNTKIAVGVVKTTIELSIKQINTLSKYGIKIISEQIHYQLHSQVVSMISQSFQTLFV